MTEPTDTKPVRHVRDYFWIVIACGIIGTVAKSSAVFVVLSVVMLALYVKGGRPVKSEK